MMKEIYLLIFYIGLFSACLMMILTQNIWYCLFFLIIIFFYLILVLFSINLQFFAILYLIIYVGAILILFLFAIMLAQETLSPLKTSSLRSIFLISILITIIILLKISIDSNEYISCYQESVNFLKARGLLVPIGLEVTGSNLLFNLAFALYFTSPYIPFLAGCLLFMAMVGSILICFDPASQIERQDAYKQISRKHTIITLDTRNVKN